MERQFRKCNFLSDFFSTLFVVEQGEPKKMIHICNLHITQNKAWKFILNGTQ